MRRYVYVSGSASGTCCTVRSPFKKEALCRLTAPGGAAASSVAPDGFLRAARDAQHGLDDAVVARAAAEVAGEADAYLVLRRIRVTREQRSR